MNRKRLDAESIRDAMLTASGRLDPEIGGPNIQDSKVLEQTNSTTPAEYDYVFADARRSVYTPAFRNRMHELFEVFDFADQNHSVSQRSVTTASTQALLMLNSQFVMHEAQTAAKRTLADEALSDEQRVERAFRETLGRKPTEAEASIALSALKNAESPLAGWERLFQSLFGCLDFRYVD
jgi:hypothetical protein